MKRTVRIFGRAVPIWFILLAVAVFGAAAWASTLYIIGAQNTFSVGVKDAPTAAASPVITACECTNADAPVCDVDVLDGTASLVTAGFDDTSSCSLRVTFTNVSDERLYMKSDALPADPNFDYSVIGNEALPMELDPGNMRYLEWTVSGNASTINAAGTAPDLVFEYTIDPVP